VPDVANDHRQRERRFCCLYQEHYRSVQAYAVRRVGSGEDAADVVAEVFTIAWRRLARIPEPPADRLWLYGVARRVVAGKLRSARRLRQLTVRLQASHAAGRHPGAQAPDSAACLDRGLADGTERDRLVAAIARLRPAEREALALVLWDELSHAEAAQVLGCSVNAVAIRVHRAKAHLRDALASTDQAGHAASPVPAAAKTNRS
jgi:RNA polymerase sigma-70 factor (ECF subfamily)